MSDAQATGTTQPSAARWRRRVTLGLLALLAVGLLLLIPDPSPLPPTPARGEVFAWNQDEVWEALEARSLAVRAMPVPEAEGHVSEALAALVAALAELQTLSLTTHPVLGAAEQALLLRVEGAFFEAAATLAARPARAAELVSLQSQLRQHMKQLSRALPPSDPVARRALYRTLYGSRAALEEVLLQMPADTMPALSEGVAETSAAPSATLRGVTVHSGDILVSRGGAPTSALIARGNDYPGNFSHVALLHIAPSGEVETIEAHIERGVVVAGIERYLSDHKLRVMLLRPRADHEALRARPDLAHAAAVRAREATLARHIPYDFEGNRRDPSQQFCSEVVSAAYGAEGLSLWEGLTTTSDPDTARWLGAFGVREFVTHGPSDLEYDPKLTVVAEWRDPEALFADHVDAAVIDALLEGARRGDSVVHDWRMLPMARVMKGYSALLNLFGRVGPVPEGMTATVALRVRALHELHAGIRRRVETAARAFEREHGYRTPYWELVRLAREARDH
ncbi:MAG: hypothetical protein IPG17_23060 [Sandaracinaceae bacterium]|nr:hypothetical protein [Sandaracinaceae bacterium]